MLVYCMALFEFGLLNLSTGTVRCKLLSKVVAMSHKIETLIQSINLSIKMTAKRSGKIAVKPATKAQPQVTKSIVRKKPIGKKVEMPTVKLIEKKSTKQAASPLTIKKVAAPKQQAQKANSSKPQPRKTDTLITFLNVQKVTEAAEQQKRPLGGASIQTKTRTANATKNVKRAAVVRN